MKLRDLAKIALPVLALAVVGFTLAHSSFVAHAKTAVVNAVAPDLRLSELERLKVQDLMNRVNLLDLQRQRLMEVDLQRLVAEICTAKKLDPAHCNIDLQQMKAVIVPAK